MTTYNDQNALYNDLIAQGHSHEVAAAYVQGAMAQFEATPSPAPDPRIDELYAHWTEQRDLVTYDSAIEHIAATNPDVDPNAFHTFVAAAEGNFQRALDMYRADRAQILADHNLQRIPGPTGPTDSYGARRAEGMSAQDALHAAVDDATAWAKHNRGR